jgi:hypothetical protein
MIAHRCKNCIWWDDREEFVRFIPKYEGKANPGFCRKHKPGAVSIKNFYYGVQPIMDAEEFCGEYRKE